MDWRIKRCIEMENEFKAFSAFSACFAGITTVVKAIIRATSLLVVGCISLLAEGSITSEDDENSEEGNLIGDYNFRTQKFDNGTDPYGWYEEDM